MDLRVKPFHPWQYLRSPAACADLLWDAIKTGHPRYIKLALRTCWMAFKHRKDSDV